MKNVFFEKIPSISLLSRSSEEIIFSLRDDRYKIYVDFFFVCKKLVNVGGTILVL